MIISRQAMDVFFQITKSSKNSQTKNSVFIILLPKSLLFLGTTPLFHSHFFSDKPCTTHTICFSYTRPFLVIAQSAVDVGAKVADIMFPPRLLPQNTTSPLLRTPHHSPLPPLKKYTDTNVI